MQRFNTDQRAVAYLNNTQQMPSGTQKVKKMQSPTANYAVGYNREDMNFLNKLQKEQQTIYKNDQ